MRRIVMFNRVTADGYFAGADGNLAWALPDDELDKEATNGMPHTDAILFGRRTYDMFASFWPHVLDDSQTAANAHDAVRRSPAMRAMAVFLNESPKLVFSRTLKDAAWQNTRILGEFDPNVVEALKQEPGEDIIIFGSGSIVSLLTQHGLIDEYQFVVSPLLLGNGRTLVSGVPVSMGLRLLEAKQYLSGNVKLRYARPS